MFRMLHFAEFLPYLPPPVPGRQHTGLTQEGTEAAEVPAVGGGYSLLLRAGDVASLPSNELLQVASRMYSLCL